eukprot:TRINITY_DN80737_c0_g1_i1.p1 TRINITY_DN80737_c0_g1~~TRINITY_DN80737_c0_g1_i1.p1  ORF type:complete len:444 (+),score=104.13 TRINITY_DN80737_c0_g1_i1:71-1402(+)
MIGNVATPPRSGGYPGVCMTPEKLELNPRKPRSMAIVLTGGPCSGKSTMLALIRDRLSKRGMQVITVPEYATHFWANSEGFQGYWVATEQEESLQDILMRYQVMQENMFHEYAALNRKQAVLLMDRGVMDQKVFCSSDKIWSSALSKNNVTEEQLLSRYDMVMHLGTCAKKGEYEWGPGSNNPGRYHSPDEAAKTDDRCKEVYEKHRQLRIVPHSQSFEDKVEQVMKYLEDALGVDGLAGKRQRVAVKVKSFPAEILASSNAFVITSTYLDQALQLSVRRRRQVSVEQWQKGLDGTPIPPAAESQPADTFEERRSIPADSYLARRVLHEAEYLALAKRAPSSGVEKHVLSFQVGPAHYELFYFQGMGGQLLLDCPATQDACLGADASLPQTVHLPAWLEHEDSRMPSLEPVGKVAMSQKRTSRVLRKNSTEEAAIEYLRRRRE